MNTSPIVFASQLSDLGPLRLLYVPTAEEHPTGMAVFPIRDWIAASIQSDTGFDDVPYWQDQIVQLGLSKDALTVVLDDGGMTEAARVWFILQYFGLPAAVLNGGLPDLQTLPAQATPGTTPDLHPGTGAVGLIGRQELTSVLPSVQIFDARSAAEFNGEDLKANRRRGHLPGAAHLDHRDLLDGRHLRPAPDLAQMLANAGISGGAPVITHCQGGERAALAALAAVAAGQEDVRVYYLSFGD
jgi:thiosulfate/3-mercaptopyruvate sulfurtransferase